MDTQRKDQQQKNSVLQLRYINFIFAFLFFFGTCASIHAQTVSQQVRGQLLDQVLGHPLEGATVSLPSLNRTVSTDKRGEFRFTGVPIGSGLQVVVSSIGYKEVILDNIQVNSGKETVLSIRMENSVSSIDAVTIKAQTKKNKPLNEMSAVSARAFSVEETQKYAAAVNDPLRMATGFPGVFATDDGNNNIVIRGNSPTGLLWRMEGIDIPNPNHFSSTGSSGGGISILSAQLLSNSDFITSAFAAEYGNALSGVFDLKLRKGNNEKKEFTLQAGLLGLNAAIEGPLFPFYKGSYLVNYRYSTLSLLNKIGVPLEGATNFQDLAFNFYMPTKRWGSFTWFGFGGLSSQNETAEKDSLKWIDRSVRYDGRFLSNTAATGITHQLMLGSKTSLRSAIAYSSVKTKSNYDFLKDDYSLREDYSDRYQTDKWTLSTTINIKHSARLGMRGGVIASLLGLDYYKKERENDQAPLEVVINKQNKTQTLQAFAQAQYKPANNFVVNAGLHYLQLMYNRSMAVEPRFSIKWQLNRSNSFAIGYGGHSQLQGLGVYFAQVQNGQNLAYPNKDLGLTKAHHYIFSYQHSFHKNLAVKTEVYYQQLYKVPVSVFDTSSFSVLNIQSEYVTDPLTNKGRGKNYGVELSLEKYLSAQFYFTISTSLYRSLYTAADGVERNTRFAGNHISNLVAGREFTSSNGLRTFGIHVKAIYAGGLRTTPIDEARSVQAGYAIYQEHKAFSQQNPAYFRTDIRLSMQWNRKRFTSIVSLDVQNVSNRLNVYGEWFDPQKQKIVTTYQNGLIPVLNYKIEF